MPYFKYNGIKITGIMASVPSQKISLSAFNPVFGAEKVERFTQETGIQSFYKAYPNQTASDLGFAAAKRLLNEENVAKESIGALIFASQSPDYRCPATACVLQHRLGLSTQCAAFDLNVGCSAFVYGLQSACAMLQCSDIQRVLLILGETTTKVTNPKDRSLAMMFGDAGAAVLLEREEGCNPIEICLKSDGQHYKSIILPAGGFRDMEPSKEKFLCSDGNERTLYDVFMDGTAVFSFAVLDVSKTIIEFLNKTGKGVEEYDSVIFHQANQLIIKQLIRKIKADGTKVPLSIQKYGNSGGVSIPLTLSHYYGKADKGKQQVLMCGFGTGLSWGVASATLDPKNIFPIVETDSFFKEGKILPWEL